MRENRPSGSMQGRREEPRELTTAVTFNPLCPRPPTLLEERLGILPGPALAGLRFSPGCHIAAFSPLKKQRNVTKQPGIEPYFSSVKNYAVRPSNRMNGVAFALKHILITMPTNLHGKGNNPKQTDGSNLDFEAQLWALRMNFAIRGIGANLGPRNAGSFRTDCIPTSRPISFPPTRCST